MNTFSVTAFYDKDQPSYCHIATAKEIYNIPLDDVLFIECHQKKSLVHMKEKTLTLPVPLYRLREILPNPIFQQTHRSFLVNLKHIYHIDKHADPWTVSFFHTDEHAYISRSFRRQIMDVITD